MPPLPSSSFSLATFGDPSQPFSPRLALLLLVVLRCADLRLEPEPSLVDQSPPAARTSSLETALARALVEVRGSNGAPLAAERMPS